MRKNNLALSSTTTSDIPQELPKYTTPDFSKSYIGASAIRRLTRKTEAGKLIEDPLQEEVPNTSIAKEFLPGIMSKRDFIWPLQSTASYSIVLKKWHGYIESVNGDEFTAVLTDPLGQSADIKAVFSKEEVSEGDRDLICENALLDWVISRDRKSHGQIENKDFLVFRRFPMWNKKDLDKKSSKVDAFNEWLNSGTAS